MNEYVCDQYDITICSITTRVFKKYVLFFTLSLFQIMKTSGPSCSKRWLTLTTSWITYPVVKCLPVVKLCFSKVTHWLNCLTSGLIFAIVNHSILQRWFKFFNQRLNIDSGLLLMSVLVAYTRIIKQIDILVIISKQLIQLWMRYIFKLFSLICNMIYYVAADASTEIITHIYHYC